MTRKATLSNSAAMGIISDDTIRAQARIAFAAIGEIDKLTGSAVQRLCYAIMAEHHTMVANSGKGKIAALDTITGTGEASKSAWLELRKLMVEFFVPASGVTQNDSDDKVAQAKNIRVANERMLDRALKLAGILAKAKVPVASFDLKSGNFTAPVKLFLKPREVVRGRLKGVANIPIDGRNFLLTSPTTDGGEKDGNANASVTRLLQVHAAPVSRGSKERNQPANVLDAIPAIASALSSKDSAIHLVNLTNDMKGHIALISNWYHAELAAEQARDKADKAKAAAKRAEQAKAEQPKPVPATPATTQAA